MLLCCSDCTRQGDSLAEIQILCSRSGFELLVRKMQPILTEVSNTWSTLFFMLDTFTSRSGTWFWMMCLSVMHVFLWFHKGLCSVHWLCWATATALCKCLLILSSVHTRTHTYTWDRMLCFLLAQWGSALVCGLKETRVSRVFSFSILTPLFMFCLLCGEQLLQETKQWHPPPTPPTHTQKLSWL